MAERVGGELLFFFDNDAVLPRPDALARLAVALLREPDLAYAQPRIAEPKTGVTVCRWVPRLRAGDPTHPGS
ncbi:hypothetical protein AB1388_26600 [Streptomyces hydrogenans]|uniref:hypothetical protein n=1 Tax=Streptomyces hydrogenans TaxID=1873719 RepID=UPI00345D1D26